jgi:putative PEP-CTERM system histidine kinase
MLWLHDDKNNGYRLVANTAFKQIEEVESSEGLFVQFLYQRDWIIDLKEMVRSPQLYNGLQIPDWLKRENDAWLVISLRHQNELYGFLILNESRLFSKIIWEDRDLLNTACMQAVSYLAFQEASDSLARSEKFAVFNRLSAYVVHDLKNLIAQLELITSNAKKFKNNPEFVDDAFETVENASQKMAHLLMQLKQGRFRDQSVSMVDIHDVMQEVVQNHQIYQPAPELHCELKNVRILVNRDRFVSIVGHIVKNAQEATDDDGYVFIDVVKNDEFVKIKVTDNGCGMSESFIKEELFNPFSTTKGNAGMGVGVYECREYIQSVGGRIDVVSILDRGTEITLSVPKVSQIHNNDEKLM